MQTDPRRAVIFESDPRGHAREWMRHILSAAGRQGVRNRLVLLVARDLAEALPATLTGGADVVPLTPMEQLWCNSGSAVQQGFAKWLVARRRLTRLAADSVFFLGIDHVLAPLAADCRMPRAAPVSGILFRPTAHYGEFDGHGETVKGRLKQKIKRDLVLRALRNPGLTSLMSLDPYFPDHAQKTMPGGGKVVSVDDPAPERHAMAETFNGPLEDRTRFLLFGEITERKGAVQLIEALKQVPIGLLRSIEVTIAGRVDPHIQERFYRHLRELEWGRPETHIRVEDAWISDEDLSALLTQTDVVLAPYQTFVGSSGVLIRAAQYRKPVICQEFGLLGQFVRDFGLGLATDASDPSKLAQALELAAKDRLLGAAGAARFDEFLKGRDANRFGNQVLQAALFRSRLDGELASPDAFAIGQKKMVTAGPRLVTRSGVHRVK